MKVIEETEIDLLDILTRESENRNKVYLYQENDHWCAYEQSAYLISQMFNGTLKVYRQVYDLYSVILVKAEIDTGVLLNSMYSIKYVSKNQLVLNYQLNLEQLYEFVLSVN